MLARLFCPTPRSGFDAALDAFHQAYANISTAFALCDGLEIIATNESFAALFNLDVERRRTTFLTRMLHDKNDLERLFAYPAVPVEFDKPERVALTVHSWALDPQFWLLHAEDQSELEDLRGQLSQTRNHDASTGTLLPGAFNAVLQRQLPQLANNDEYGLLCQIYLVPFNHQNPNLNREETSELITDLVEKLHWEFGTECPACCNETLALTIFLPFGSAHGEDQHVLNQMRRIAIQTVKAHRSQLLVHIGAAAFPEDGRTVSQLLMAADLARRSITERDGEKGGTAIRSSPDIVQARLRNTQLALDMAAAIDNGEITPHFQPVIEPATGNIQSFEALIRWHHPELGRVAPPDIIAIACGANLLDVLTEQTLRHTARQAKNWPAPVKFAINVTPSQLNSNLVDLVRRTTREMSLDPARLEIEVTEDALIHDFKTSASIFARLRAIGVSIAMDDFGSGYTSVSNLRLLNFDKIKIDKSISDGLPDDHRSVAIVRSLMYMARELEVRITVEGIETQDQLEFLRAFNCGVQGYIYSPPVPPSQLHELKRFLPRGDEPRPDNKILGIGPRKLPRSGIGKLAR